MPEFDWLLMALPISFIEMTVTADWSMGFEGSLMPAGDALFQTHENLEHLAMMETVLGRIPESMAAAANENARRNFTHRSCPAMITRHVTDTDRNAQHHAQQPASTMAQAFFEVLKDDPLQIRSLCLLRKVGKQKECNSQIYHLMALLWWDECRDARAGHVQERQVAAGLAWRGVQQAQRALGGAPGAAEVPAGEAERQVAQALPGCPGGPPEEGTLEPLALSSASFGVR